MQVSSPSALVKLGLLVTRLSSYMLACIDENISTSRLRNQSENSLQCVTCREAWRLKLPLAHANVNDMVDVEKWCLMNNGAKFA